MISKAELKAIRDEIISQLREAQRYTEQDILNRHPTSTVGELRELRRVIWEAREILRMSEGIDFGPLRGWPGVFERKDWSQIERRAALQRAKGTRAHMRAEQRLRLAATLAPDQSKERLNEAADRMAVRLAMRSARSA